MCVLEPLIKTLQKKTFLMTWIREPAERILSQFYHLEVSRENMTPTDQHIIDYLEQHRDNYIIKYISTGESVSDILRKYDFIGITDRFEESMLVLAHRLGLDIEDVLYLKAKDSHRLKVDNKGFRFVPSVPVEEQSDSVQQYLKEKWYVIDVNVLRIQ